MAPGENEFDTPGLEVSLHRTQNVKPRTKMLKSAFLKDCFGQTTLARILIGREKDRMVRIYISPH